MPDDDAGVEVRQLATARVSQPRRTLFHRHEKRETLRGRDDQAPLRLVALAVRPNVLAIAQVLVHDAPIRGEHRRQRHGLALRERTRGCAVGLRPQLGLALAR